jgi:hypothetical protein
LSNKKDPHAFNTTNLKTEEVTVPNPEFFSPRLTPPHKPNEWGHVIAKVNYNQLDPHKFNTSYLKTARVVSPHPSSFVVNMDPDLVDKPSDFEERLRSLSKATRFLKDDYVHVLTPNVRRLCVVAHSWLERMISTIDFRIPNSNELEQIERIERIVRSILNNQSLAPGSELTPPTPPPPSGTLPTPPPPPPPRPPARLPPPGSRRAPPAVSYAHARVGSNTPQTAPASPSLITPVTPSLITPVTPAPFTEPFGSAIIDPNSEKPDQFLTDVGDSETWFRVYTGKREPDKKKEDSDKKTDGSDKKEEGSVKKEEDAWANLKKYYRKQSNHRNPQKDSYFIPTFNESKEIAKPFLTQLETQPVNKKSLYDRLFEVPGMGEFITEDRDAFKYPPVTFRRKFKEFKVKEGLISASEIV